MEFQGLSATSERFSLETGQSRDDLVFKLDLAPIPISVTPNRVTPDTKGVWVLNPANGHSYKRIHCNSWKDAQAKAVAEDAYLVSINNAAEQQWLLEVFGTNRYWIGLTDIAKEGEWLWTSGEPVTYTNWAPYRPINADKSNDNYVFTDLYGEWSNIVRGNMMWWLPKEAIIEKDNLPAKTPAKE